MGGEISESKRLFNSVKKEFEAMSYPEKFLETEKDKIRPMSDSISSFRRRVNADLLRQNRSRSFLQFLINENILSLGVPRACHKSPLGYLEKSLL